MNRRAFFLSSSLAGAATTAFPADAPSASLAHEPEGQGGGRRGPRTMLFFDWFHFDEAREVELVQGKPVWRPEATYADPFTGTGLGAEPFFDAVKKRWFKIGVNEKGIAEGYKGLFMCESDDGIAWRPANLPDVKPPFGEKVAPHHIHTFQCKNWGSFYEDPLAVDGYRYKLAIQHRGEWVYERAIRDPKHPWHEVAKKTGKLKGTKDLFMAQESYLVSRDGLKWEDRFDYDWGRADWHPEEPYFSFFNARTGEHCMTPRAGWGDRRVCLIKTRDFKTWTEPRVVMQPDAQDGVGVEFYTMAVTPYAHGYIGLVWAAHFANSKPVEWGVQSVGTTDGYLAWSDDGERWVRPSREVFVPCNAPPLPGCGMTRPERIIELDDEIRIYSNASIALHGSPPPKEHKGKFKHMVMHSLRKDGFMHLAPRGHSAELLTKKITFLHPEATFNAQAILGEVRMELRDERNRAPLPGFSFDDFIPLHQSDSLKHPLRWKTQPDLTAAMNKPLRLAIRLEAAQLYSIRGDYHFLDAADENLLANGLPINTTRFGN